MPRLIVLDSSFHGTPESTADLHSNLASGAAGLASRLVHLAKHRSSVAAIQTANQSWTYGQLLHAATAFAARVQCCPGFSCGGRVILLLPNSFEYVAAFYGTLLAGGVVVPLPPAIEDQKFEQICDSVEAAVVAMPQGARRLPICDSVEAAVVAMPQGARRLPTAVKETAGADVLSLLSSPADPSIPWLPVEVNEHDLATIFFTAGSTGDPKGVMLSHRNLIENASSIQQYLEISESDRPLCILPFYHAFGNSVLQSHLLAGGTLILDGKTLFPETILTAIGQHQATSLSGVPDLFRLLLERTSLGTTPLATLRYMAVAGGALPRDLALEVALRIKPARFFVMYGQTEATARLAYVPPESLPDVPAGCIGRAIPGVQLEIVDEQGSPVPPGTTGELRAAGPNVMLGYWKDEQGTVARLNHGWLMTGDLASRDENGWISHQGRKNAILKIAGFRVHPGDLEEFAVRRLLVSQAVVVPFEQPQAGTRLALFYRSQTNSPTTAEMLARCRDELPRYLVPSLIHPLDQFPLNHAFKIDRIRLAQMAEEQSAASVRRFASNPTTVQEGIP